MSDNPKLADLLDDIVAAVGEVLVTHYELQLESVGSDIATDAAKEKVMKIKTKLDAAKLKVVKTRQHQNRKSELLALNRKHKRESERTTNVSESKELKNQTIISTSGQVLGRIVKTGKNMTNYLSANGSLVCRVTDAGTYDSMGRLVSAKDIGLLVLGHSIRTQRLP